MGFLAKPPQSWDSDDVVAFLESMGLGHCAPAFKHNAVTGADLLNLREEDFKNDLGMTGLQVRKVQTQLQQLGATVASAPAPAAAFAPAPVADTRSYQAPPAGYPEMHPAPVHGYPAPMPQQNFGPDPNVVRQQRMQASQLLGQAAGQLQQAISLLNSAKTSAAVGTGINLAKRTNDRRRGFTSTLVNVAMAGSQDKKMDGVDIALKSACNSISQAQSICPEIPHIDMAQVRSLSGGVLTTIFAPTVTQAMRATAISSQSARIQNTLTQVQMAQRFLQN